MRFVLERVSQPEIEPVSLTEMKRHLRMFDDITDEDDDVEGLITGAREWVEDYTGRALIDQSWRLTLTDQAATWDTVTGAPAGVYAWSSPSVNVSEIPLLRSPVLAITSFKTVDSAGDETTIDAATYELREADSKWPKLVGLDGASWGSGTHRIVFRAGYANRDISPAEGAEVVPARMKQAMKLWAEAMYDRDEKMMQRLLETAEGLITGERCHLDFA